MNKLLLKCFSCFILLIPTTGIGNFSHSGLPVYSNYSMVSIYRLYQRSPLSSQQHAERQSCMLERTIFFHPDSNYQALSVAEYWKVSCPTDMIVSAPNYTCEIQIQLPDNAEKLILPDNSHGIFQKIDTNLVIFTPALSLDAAQSVEFPLLYELPYPEDEKITFKNTLNSSRISISLPASDIRIEADGFSYDGKRSIEETLVDVYRSHGMQADSQFTIQLIRSNPPVTPTSQKTGFLVTLASLALILAFWFRTVVKKHKPFIHENNAGQ